MLLLLACLAVPPSPDCDDADASVHAGAPEYCDGVDDDCDGEVDEDAVDAVDWYLDADEDGFGGGVPVRACEAPPGHVASGLDCDDADAGVHPGAGERCDGEDDDCDGVVDDDASPTTAWWSDVDGDGYGDDATEVRSCLAPEGYAPEPGDCDDADPSVHERAEDTPEDGIDQDCDGYDAEPPDDADGDGSERWEDCDDSDAGVSPEAPQTCGEVDENCDGTAPPVRNCRAIEDLATLVVEQEEAGISLGSSVAFIGDHDGDGLDDLALGAPRDDTVDENAGSVLIVSGGLRGTTTGGVVLRGDSTTFLVGRYTLLGADTDGDGFSEVLTSGSAEAYVMAGPLRADTDLADARAIFSTEERAYPSIAADDLDGDGRADVVFGAADGIGGAASLWYGPMEGDLTPDSADARVSTDGGDRTGETLALPGDLDGDGLGELVVGASEADDHGVGSGRVGIFAGPVLGNLAWADADALLEGDSAYDRVGLRLARAGDNDGDGLPDLLVGGTFTRGGESVAAAYLVHGGPLEAATFADLGDVVVGDAYATIGALAADGDPTGDGFADILVGDAAAEDDQGAAFLFCGPLAGVVPLSDANLQLLGPEPNGQFGASVALDGRVNDDSREDLLVGAPNAVGAAWLMWGS